MFHSVKSFLEIDKTEEGVLLRVYSVGKDGLQNTDKNLNWIWTVLKGLLIKLSMNR